MAVDDPSGAHAIKALVFGRIDVEGCLVCGGRGGRHFD
jgi:hypothetical protein